jgi:hypothetical protein
MSSLKGKTDHSPYLAESSVQPCSAQETTRVCICDPCNREKNEQFTALRHARPAAETLSGFAREFLRLIRHLKGNALISSCVA